MKNCIIGKIINGEGFYKLGSLNRDIYIIPNLENSITYDPETKRDYDEWYKYNEFSKCKYSIPLISKKINTTNYNQNTIKKDYISYICSIDDNDGKFLFQKVENDNVLRNKSFLKRIDNNIEVVKMNYQISVNKLPDAIYDRNSDTLYFRNLSKTSIFFPGIEELYRYATDSEVTELLNSDFIELNDNYDNSKVSKTNKHRIAIALDKLKAMNKKEKTNLFKYMNDYLSVEYRNNKYVINNDTDLKNLLYGINERYYTTPITKEKILANSIIPMK